MARVYVSSTFKDLKECREKVRLYLRKMGHEDVSMEYYVSEDKRPVDKCLEDVASCDLYLGIFAWRYGYVPDGKDKSITELEYQKAVETGKDCLIFLLDEDAPWPIKFVDIGKDAEKIRALRNLLSTRHTVSFFESVDELASLVSVAVYKWKAPDISLFPEEEPEEEIIELNLKQYKEAIQKTYLTLDLDALTPSKKEDFLRIQLSSVFVEQNVRENAPPSELPEEILKKMYDEWNQEWYTNEYLTNNLTPEDVKHARESYDLENPKAVLDVISDDRSKYVVILGDPGSGKSTLTKYIILSVLQINNENKLSKFFNSYLPLRVELREFASLYAENKCNSFLDYFQYLAETEGYNLKKEDITKYLIYNGKAIIIFDGLDEIFSPNEWERINRMIVGFTLDYPKVRIIVTSRIVGYKRKILDDAGFAHFTLQDLEKEQIEIFLDKWYPLVVDRKEIESRKSRILKALEDSPSIRQLAGNPLLLTILAIIGKHQELPRERWKLYDHAAGVLIENWEVNKHLVTNSKRIRTDIDFIREDDKKELLMMIAFKMQSSPGGLKGNFIHRKALQKEIETYIQNRFQKNVSEARLISESIINQLRERDFILCFYGADFYGFVHRTFLEYFCAKDIVQKFDNREFDIETLESNYFKGHWEDPAWHEVLRLVCGMKERFAGNFIESLMEIYDPPWFGNRPPLNISLAIKCLSELRNPNAIKDTAKKLLERVFKLFEIVRWNQDINTFLEEEVVPSAKMVGSNWPLKESYVSKFTHNKTYIKYSNSLYWSVRPSYIDMDLNNTWAEFVAGVCFGSKLIYKSLLKNVRSNSKSKILSILVLGKLTSKKIDLSRLFLNILKNNEDEDVRAVVCQELTRLWSHNPEVIKEIKQIAFHDSSKSVQIIALQGLARNLKNDNEVVTILGEKATRDPSVSVRIAAVQEFTRAWSANYEIIPFLRETIMRDANWDVRSTAVEELAKYWPRNPEIKSFLARTATQDQSGDVRATAIREYSRNWSKDPETFNFVKRSAKFETHKVRIAALRELVRWWSDKPDTLKMITDFAIKEVRIDVRTAAIKELARVWPEDPNTLQIIKESTNDLEWEIRAVAIKELAQGWPNNETINILKQKIKDQSWDVRAITIRELARGCPDDEILNILKQKIEDQSWDVKAVAIQALAQHWPNDETFEIIKKKAIEDPNITVKLASIKELTRIWHNNETFNIIKNIAKHDNDKQVRIVAIQEISMGWLADSENFKEKREALDILCYIAKTDKDKDVKDVVIQELNRI